MIAPKPSGEAPSLLVIGAGPAGVSAAIRLRMRGHAVLLVDKAIFPRDKLCGCCLNLAALGALSTINCDHVVTRLTAQPLNRWQMSLGDRRIESSLPGGVAISRYAMDSALVEEAKRRGVEFRPDCEARVIEVSDDSVDVIFRDDSHHEPTQSFQAVVFATGLSGGGVSKWLPFVDSPRGPIGAGMVLDRDDASMAAIEPGTIYMICGRDGYVGLVRLEDGRIDVASAIRKRQFADEVLNRKEIATRVDRLLSSSGLPKFAVPRESELKMTPPLTRSRVVGSGALIAVGDAAQYVEPFTGEGMAWAIESGIEAANCIADKLEGKAIGCLTVADLWKIRYVALTRRRQWACRALSTVLGSDRLSACVIPAIRIAPWMVKTTIAHLNRPRK